MTEKQPYKLRLKDLVPIKGFSQYEERNTSSDETRTLSRIMFLGHYNGLVLAIPAFITAVGIFRGLETLLN